MIRNFAKHLFLFLMLSTLAACESAEEIYSNLSVKEANEMVALLRREGIDANREGISSGGYRIVVPKENFSDAVSILSDHGYPKEQFKSLEQIFPGDGLIVSPLEQKARLSFALNEELSRTITLIDGVIRARVHVVIPDTETRVGAKQRASAAVSVHYSSDIDPADLGPKIRLIVSNAVPNLDYSNVSISFFEVGSRSSRNAPKDMNNNFENGAINDQDTTIGLSNTRNQNLSGNINANNPPPSEAAEVENNDFMSYISSDDSISSLLRIAAIIIGVIGLFLLLIRIRRGNSNSTSGNVNPQPQNVTQGQAAPPNQTPTNQTPPNQPSPNQPSPNQNVLNGNNQTTPN